MNITEHHDGPGTVRLHLAGDLDLATAGLLEQRMTDALAAHRPRLLVIDAGELGFCDSSGVYVLIRGRTLALGRGSSYQVTNLGGRSLRALAITGVLDKLSTVSSPPRATAPTEGAE
jgi:anti-sigma B factor antagonist